MNRFIMRLVEDESGQDLIEYGLLVVVAGRASLMERAQLGSVLDQAEPLQSVASDAWMTALAATAEFRKSASRDLSTVLKKIRNAAEKIVGEMGDGAEVDAEPEAESSSSGLVVSRRLPTLSLRRGRPTSGPPCSMGVRVPSNRMRS